MLREDRSKPDRDDLYATPRHVADTTDCVFYHVMEIPGEDVVGGDRPDASFDLRGGEADYLGHVSVDGLRVLEIGPANGFLTFHMESQGADVVAVELGPDAEWDSVPHSELDLPRVHRDWAKVLAKMRNGFWWAHERTRSSAKVHYGDVYALPDALGRFDLAVLAAVLLHTREPLRIIDQCARLTDRIVITELSFPELDGSPVARLHPERSSLQWDTWWDFSPEYLTRYLGVLGFEDFTVTHHGQRLRNTAVDLTVPMFTIVAERPGAPAPGP